MENLEQFSTVCNGVAYTHFRLKNEVAGVFGLKDKRYIIKCKPKFSITNGSYKFDKEFQISMAIHKDIEVKEETRNFSKWNILEINMPIEELDNIILALQELKKLVKKDEK